ncbi:MAG: hypothetical protein JXA90_10130, partial [Planctomycetes bacterium]|nr:hypothetical protein [Planctomycetota bacterium]
MRIGVQILVASIALLSAETIFADGPVLEAIPSRSIEPVVLPAGLAEVGGAGETAPEVLFETSGLVVARPSARDIELASIVRRKGEGGGGDIAAGSLVLIQTFFLDSKCSYPPCGGSPCNALLVLWDENSYNPEGVDVYVNDEKLGTLPGLPPEDLPGINLAPIYPLPPGPCLIRIEDPNTGSSEQAEILVLDSQPFGDVQRMRCQQGELEIGGTCGLIATWTTPGPLPSYLGALVNGEVAAVLDPDTRGLPLVGVPPGTYTVEVVGLLENAEGNYRGCYPSATCTLDCASDACVKPAGVYVAQRTYG